MTPAIAIAVATAIGTLREMGQGEQDTLLVSLLNLKRNFLLCVANLLL